MHRGKNQRGWAIAVVAVAICAGLADPVMAQKFARSRSTLTTPAPEFSPSDSASSQPSPPERPRIKSHKVAPRTSSLPNAVRSRTPRFAPSPFVPDWQRSPTASRRGRVIRHSQGQQIEPQEGDIIIEEPNFSGAEAIGPGVVDGATSGPLSPRSPSRVFQDDSPVVGDAVIDADILDDGTVIEEGDIISDDRFSFGGACGSCGKVPFAGPISPYYDLGSSSRPPVPCDGICIPRHWVDEIALFAGPQGFVSPVDMGSNGNFGYHEGVNLSGQFGRWLGLGPLGLGYQVGATFLQSDFQGATILGPKGVSRNQQFFTAGIFRRAHAGYGLQGGVVYDYMHDTFYAKYSVAQVRVELSYLTLAGHEFGYWGAYHIHDGHDIVAGVPFGFRTIDLYNAFYRYNFANGTQGRVWAGGTGNKGGDLGGDVRLPLSNQWDLWAWYNYMIPGAGSTSGGSAQQAWNLTFNIVWYPGRKPQGVHNTPFRALFAPADNNWLISRPTM